MARQPSGYYRPKTVAEAVRLISQPHLSTTLLSGGALRLASPEAPEYEAVVDLQAITELQTIRGLDTGGLSLGANASLMAVSEHPQMPPLLRQVVRRVLPPVKRRMITVGEAVELAAGVPEVIAALLALDAVVVFALPEEHRLALSEMGLTVEQPRLPRKGLIVALELPEPPGRVWGEAHVARTPADDAIVCAMVVLDVAKPGIVRTARVALCGVWPEPARLAEAAGLLVGQALTDDQIERTVAGIQAEVAPVADYQGSAEYRRTMAGVLTRRALLQARERLAGENDEGVMDITLTINGELKTLRVHPADRLLAVLRRAGYFSVKFGDEHGRSGASIVLLDGQPVDSLLMLAAQAQGHAILTAEGLGTAGQMHPLQKAFIETGAIQSGYNTPAQLLVAKALLDRNPNPTEAEVREALSSVLDRETGYVKPVQAVLRAAAMLRGEPVEPFEPLQRAIPIPSEFFEYPPEPEGGWGEGGMPHLQTRTRPLVVAPPELTPRKVVGKPEPKVDAVKLALGRAVFADDFEMKGLLYAAMLTSPHANARIKHIDASAARALPGVHAVLTYQDVPRIKYASGGQSYPNPKPYDQVSLDDRVRHVGDRVAVVAAETPEIAQEAVRLIEVEYEVLPAVFDPEEAMRPGAPLVHDEPDTEGIHDPQRNIVHHIHAEAGDAAAQWAKADFVFEGEYRTHQVQQASIEPHICVTYWDEDDRLVVRTSTQVPFHVRRMLAPLVGLPVRRIRVIKPRVGGGFGGKQEMLIEDLCAHLTIATGRPVRFEYTREQEFTSSRSRHPQILRFKTGVTKDGRVVAAELYIIGNTGAYGTHGLTVQMVSGFRGLSTYNAPYSKFVCDVVYTNLPTPGAYRGYGAPQALYALEIHMEEIADKLGLDVVEFKRKNWIKVGDGLIMSKALGEGREGFEQIIKTSGLAECVDIGLRAMQWESRRGKPGDGPVKRGLGMAVAMHGSGIAGLDMGAASIKINDDGSFNLMVGATDLGTGSDTVLAQIAAEVLGVPLEDILIYSSDTDFTPFDTGAYASSTTFISGGAVFKAAMDVRKQILAHAARHFFSGTSPDELELEDRQVLAPDGRAVALEQVALHSLHQGDQHQIMATASHMSLESPPPFAAQFAEVLVDTETGQVTVERLLMVVDCGIAINPITASGQVEGGMVQALGYAHCEEMAYDEDGRLVNPRFDDYRLYRADEMPALEVIFVETDEPSGPFGAKAVAEIPKDGVAPALASAIHDATGVWIRELPYTPERVWRALHRA